MAGSLEDKAGTGGEDITAVDISRAFREACWDTWLANLPDPIVINANDPAGGKDVPAEFQEHVMRGFAFDPRTCKTYFNAKDIPATLQTRKEKLEYARSIFHHEVGGHYGIIPKNIVLEACLIDAAIKGFRDTAIRKDPGKAASYSHTVVNILSDIILDTYMAQEGYGREDLGELTCWRQRETIRNAQGKVKTPSAIWQVLVRTYEKLWKEDLGVSAIVPAMKNEYDAAANELTSILGTDWKDTSTWEAKAGEFARVLEPFLKQSVQEGKQGTGMQDGKPAPQGSEQLPDDIRSQMGGTPDRSQVWREDAGKTPGGEDGGTQVDERVLEEIYKRNSQDPEGFAGTMSALHGIEGDDTLRLMYRARASEFRIRIAEREHQRDERRLGPRTSWRPGDPVLGRGGLEMAPSMLPYGQPVPYLTTSKRRIERSDNPGRLSMIPNLLLVIDSSGSMAWNPKAADPDRRGEFDKAIIAGEAAALEALEHGGKVAVINFSGPQDVRLQEYTRDMDKIEQALMHDYKAGTTVPTEQVRDMLRRSQDPLQTCLLSDCDISNAAEAADAFAPAARKPDELAVFLIGKTGEGDAFVDRLRAEGAVIHPVLSIDDLAGIVLGTVRGRYMRGRQ
jgi:hypothetical protein